MASDPDPVDLVRHAAAFYRHEGARLAEARERWGLGDTAFYQAVNAAIDDPTVALAAPAEVARLLRLRESRQRQRQRQRRAS